MWIILSNFRSSNLPKLRSLKENITTKFIKEKLANLVNEPARKISKPRETAFKVIIDLREKLYISNMYFTFV